MAPVPARPLKLSDLDEQDRTAYFSVTALVERGKAVATRLEAAAPPGEAAPPAEPMPEVELPLEPSLWDQVRRASLPRKGMLVLLPLLLGLLLLKPVFEKAPPPEPATPSTGEVADGALGAQHEARLEPRPEPRLASTPAEPPPALPKGVTLERAATDALAGGDFPRALGFYRELSRQQPHSAAYQEATRILERRQSERQP